MTTALSLLELPAASREHEQIVSKEPAIDEAMIKKFIAYLDVSRGTMINYEYGLKTFLLPFFCLLLPIILI
jgi:hypothetical protein